MKYSLFVNFIFIVVLLAACNKKEEQIINKMESKELTIKEKIAEYAPVHITADRSHLTDKEKQLVKLLAEAGKLTDEIFWKQQSHDAIAVRDSLKNLNTPEAKELLEYVKINYGPYDGIYDSKRFLGNGASTRPIGGGYYPDDLTKDEFENYLQSNPDKADALKGQYTVVVRDGKNLKAIPFNEYYPEAKQIADKLDAAAKICDDPALKKYLELRAKAFRTDEYYESDLAWMDVKDGKIDVVIGPIENYTDEMYNYKTAHEAVVMIKDPNATKELEMYKSNMPNFEKSLPIEDKYKQSKVGEGNIIQVVNVVYFGGDCQQGIKTIAAALPNDPKVADAKGRKLSMYKNFMEAKFDKIVNPIGQILLTPEFAKFVDKKAFTSFVTLHEVSHALGPKYVFTKKDEEVRRALKDRYSAIEECKADILSMYNHKYLFETKQYDELYIKKAMATYLAGLYRSVRFGTGAHFNANMIQINFLRESGAIIKNADGKMAINEKIFFEKVGELAKLILMIQSDGDYKKAGEIIEKYGKATDELKKEIDLLKSIPRDINTTYDF